MNQNDFSQHPDPQSEREKYVLAFNDTMLNIWQEQITLQNVIYIDERIQFQEIDKYFFSGCACAYFQIAVDTYTDLQFNEAEWTK